ncbi:MAG: helix-turn-helix domain-containing protein [Acidobacteriia bacterium]|nr:helix-turn-helix domain-containing protein [Terriglobia bacterium]
MQVPAKVRKNLGKRIRQLREKRGWSQEEFALKGKLGRSFAGSVERGERDIRIQTLCKLADVFGITLSELFKGTDGYK